jgi:hypothetical protein
MRKYIAWVVLIGGLIAAVLLWWPREMEQPKEVVVGAAPSPDPVKEEHKPANEVAPTSEPPNSKTVPVADADASKSPFKSSGTPNNTGIYKKFMSDDFKAYLEFVSLAMAAEIGPDGRVKDQAGLNSYKFVYKQLSEEDFKKLMDFSAAVLEADRKFQTEAQKAICDEKSKPRSIQELGVALNKFAANAEKHQESLAHKAQLSAEPVFLEVFHNVRRQPQREVTKADFPTLLAARNRDLDAEVMRFCTVPSVGDSASAK